MKDRFTETYRKLISEGLVNRTGRNYIKEEVHKELYGKTIVNRTLEFYPGWNEPHGDAIKEDDRKCVIKKIVKSTNEKDPSDVSYDISLVRSDDTPSKGMLVKASLSKDFDKWIAGLSQSPVFSKKGDFIDGRDEWYDCVRVSPVQATFDPSKWGYGDDLEHYVFEENVLGWTEYYEKIRDKVAEMRKELEDKLAAFDKRYEKIMHTAPKR